MHLPPSDWRQLFNKVVCCFRVSVIVPWNWGRLVICMTGHPDYVKEGVKCSCCSHVFCLKGSTFVLGSSWIDFLNAGSEDGVTLSKSGGSGPGSTGPRIGYSGQGFYSQPHHAQYKVLLFWNFHLLLLRLRWCFEVDGHQLCSHPHYRHDWNLGCFWDLALQSFSPRRFLLIEVACLLEGFNVTILVGK